MRSVRRAEDNSTTIILTILFAVVGVFLCLGGVAAVVIVVVAVSNSSSSKPTVAEPKNERVIPGDMYASIQQSVSERKLVDVSNFGFEPNRDRPYREVPPEGAILIGFQVGLAPFFADADVIGALRPIFLTRNGEKLGQWYGKAPVSPIILKAKTGYAVSAVNLRTGLLIDNISVKFAKLGQGRLHLDDSYDSPAAGGQGGEPNTLGGDGAIFVGVCGNMNQNGQPYTLALVTLQLFKQ
jgi:hypothetical protein